MSDTPETKPAVPKKEEEKKRGGFWPSWTSKLGGGTGATGGAGASGGLLATKAGIIGLALIGTAVAAGIGFVGYKTMSPSSSSGGRTFSIFEARPQQAATQDSASDESAASGESGSLSMFVSANKGPGAGQSEAADGSDASGEVDAPEAGDGTASGSASADSDSTKLMGRAKDMPKAKLSGKIGQPSGSRGGGGTSASYSAGQAGPSAAHRGKKGSLKAMSGSPKKRSAGGKKGMRSLRRGSNWRTLGQVRKDHRGATSSQGAGTTYDGNTQTGTIGAEAGFPEGGAGQGSDPSGDTDATPNAGPVTQEQPEAETVTDPVEVTPWAEEIAEGKNMLMLAAMLLFMAAKLAMVKEPSGLTTALKWALCIAGIAAALYALSIGVEISQGEYKQGLMGGIFIASGGFLAATGVLLLAEGDGMEGKDLADMPVWLGLCGVVGMAGMAYALMMATPDTELCDGGEDPDECDAMIHHIPRAPTDGILDQYDERIV